jgi:hypothetical protein
MVSKSAVYRSINCTPEHAAKLDMLVEESGLNRNQFFRLLLEALTPSDVEKLRRRLDR